MAASDEWQVMHLTASGWVLGGGKYDDGQRIEDVVPAGAVLSVCRHVTVGKLGVGSSMNVNESETPRAADRGMIEMLLSKYGKPQFGV